MRAGYWEAAPPRRTLLPLQALIGHRGTMRSFDTDPSVTTTDTRGQLAHRRALEQSRRMARKLYAVRPGVWTLIGNGLSNQTFIEGPACIIAIDTGESVQEMRSALRELRAHTAAPVAAVIYTHFHYVSGTRAVFEEAGHAVPVYGHERILANLARVSTEIGPAYMSGLVHQFGLRLPYDGPDGLVNEGLGLYFRNPEHAPFTPGFVPPSVMLRGGERLEIGGLKVDVALAPSDADDSVTLWFPELGVCVQNIVWPTLFNIFPIRGEEYRDPRVLLPGIDHVLDLKPDHLLGTHGPPISGAAEISVRVTRYRDAIQFLWDQTVRGMNKGLYLDELARSVVLPASCDDDYLTSEFYGVAEHHVRQIACGIRGWFDGDPAHLFPLEPAERADRMVRSLGGADAVRALVTTAKAENDLRWALELASCLVAHKASDSRDRGLLAGILRDVAYRTMAANIRNWCLTKARDLDGSTTLAQLRTHRLRATQLGAMKPRECLHLMRVFLDPLAAAGIDHHIAFRFTDHPRAGLHVRNSISVATDGTGADSEVGASYADWVAVLTGTKSLSELASAGAITLTGSSERIRTSLACFEIPGLRA